MCKPLGLEDLAKLNLFKKNQTEITSKIAYLIGVKEENMKQFFEDEEDEIRILEKSSCKVIRNLNILRTKLLTHYSKTENAFRYDLSGLEGDINKHCAKCFHLHTITTESAHSSSFMGGYRIQAVLVFESLT